MKKNFISSTIKWITLLLTSLLLSGCAVMGPSYKADYIAEPVEMPFAFVEGGELRIGAGRQTVRVNDLLVGIFEVTFKEYDAFCEATGREKPHDEDWGRGNRPVINVSWHDANAYTEWLSKETGQVFRLPSEAEWEYFARAGTTTKYWTGDELPNNAANCSECGSKWDNKQTAPVGSFAPNPWGIFDTAGNVSEWTMDDYQGKSNALPQDGSPLIIENNTRKTIRGGSWGWDKSDLRSAARDSNDASSKTNTKGFRVVSVPDQDLTMKLTK